LFGLQQYVLPDGSLNFRSRVYPDSIDWEVFCRVDEAIFEVLYSDKASRPNVPVNVLVGLEILKAGFGWSDEEFCF
jgi:hypothetical protein